MADQETTAISTTPQPQRGVDVEQLPRGDFFRQVVKGIGISSGLALLWVLETGRNIIFVLLERLHIPAPRHRRGSAFPPGRRRRS